MSEDLKAYVASEPVKYTKAHNLQGTEELLWYSVIAESVTPAPDEWALVFGDAIQNIRDALDYVVWETIVGSRGDGFAIANAAQIQFPIIDESKKFPASKLLRLGLDSNTVEYLRSWQPYAKEPQNPHDDALWLLRVLSNVDKHRLLHTVAMVGQKAVVTTQPAVEDADPQWMTKKAIKAGDEVVRFRAKRPPGYQLVTINVNLEVAVCIEATDQTKPAPIDLTMRGLYERVTEILDRWP
jgi:hypothetical protein